MLHYFCGAPGKSPTLQQRETNLPSGDLQPSACWRILADATETPLC